MAIQDSDPERRNLLVTSLAFITYFYAGGAFTDTTLRLQLINVSYSKPHVLAVLSWILFFWFLYRYWLTHKSMFREAVRREVLPYYETPTFLLYASKATGIQFAERPSKDGYVLRIVEKGLIPKLEYVKATNLGWGKAFFPINYSIEQNSERGKISLKTFRGTWYFCKATLRCFYHSPSFSEHAIPYLLVIVAVLGPAYRLMVE